DRLDATHWQVAGRRAEHLRRVRGLLPGEQVPAGECGGLLGQATLLGDDGHCMRFHFHGTLPPPAPLPLTLILALPRPKMLKRILIDATSLGIKRIVLLNS